VAQADDLAAAYYRAQQTIARRAADAAQGWWGQLDQADLTGSWLGGVGSRVVAAVAAGQLTAASVSDGYVPAQVAAQGGTPAPEGQVAVSSLAGVASDGRDLSTLLYLPVITTKQRIAVGMPLPDALDAGLRQLVMMASTQVQDAGRVAAGVGIVAERQLVGYVRQLTPPSCARCAVLAGRFYRWNRGFQRHPRCDCIHRPVYRGDSDTASASARTDSRAYFNSLQPAEQDRVFTAAGAQAIRDGSDLNQVVNARRGMSTAGVTTEGTTVSGVAGRRLAGQPRLMPEQIYQMAAGNRDEAIKLLARNGYLL
jgi:hypothetical protein